MEFPHDSTSVASFALFALLLAPACVLDTPVGANPDATETGGPDSGKTETSGDASTTTGDPTTTNNGTTGAPESTGMGPVTTSTTTTTNSTSSTSSSTGDTTGESTDTGVELDCVDGVAWVKNFGPQPQYIITDLVIDAQGNAIAVGAFWEQVDLGGGLFVTEGSLPDGFIVKYGPLGEHLWSRQFGDLEDQRAKHVALDPSGNLLVMGDFEGSMEFDGNLLTSAGSTDEFVVKLTPAGDHVWSKSFGGPGFDSGFGVASDSAGNVVLFAQGSGPVDFGGGPLGDDVDAHVVKLSPEGAHLWHHLYSATNLFGSMLAVDPNDDIVTMGWFGQTVDFGGGPEASLEGHNIYVTKLDSAGQFQWTRQNGGHQEYFLDLLPGGLTTDDAGNIRIAGVFQDTVDFGGPLLQSEGEWDVWIAALSPDGEHMWSSSHGSGPTSQQFVNGIATNSAGRTAVVGNFSGTISFGDETLAATYSDAYVARLAPDGTPDLARSFGGPGLHYATAVAIDEDGGMWVSGEFDQPFEAGGELLVPAGEGRNAYMMRLCP